MYVLRSVIRLVRDKMCYLGRVYTEKAPKTCTTFAKFGAQVRKNPRIVGHLRVNVIYAIKGTLSRNSRHSTVFSKEAVDDHCIVHVKSSVSHTNL